MSLRTTLLTWYITPYLIVILDAAACVMCFSFFFVQAEDGIRDLVRSRGLGDVYKRQLPLRRRDSRPGQNGICQPYRNRAVGRTGCRPRRALGSIVLHRRLWESANRSHCLLYTSDAADERSSVDLGGRRIIKKKKNIKRRTAGDKYRMEHRDEKKTQKEEDESRDRS